MRENPKFKREARLRRKARVRKRIQGTSACPRLSVFRGNRHIFAQLIDDQSGITVAAASSVKIKAPKVEGDVGRKVAIAQAVGAELAKKATEKGISAAVFDRGGFQYHGRVAALAKGAREGGLKF